MLDVNKNSKSQRRRRIIVVVAIMAVAGLSTLWGYHRWRYAREIAHIRAAGEPVTLAELAEFHSRPSASNETTYLWLDAIAALAPAMNSRKSTTLPIVGRGPLPIPLPGEEWDQLDEAQAYLALYVKGLQLAHQAAKKNGEARFPIDYSAGYRLRLSHITEVRHVYRMLQLEASVRAHQGNAADVADSLCAMVAAAESFKNEPILISQALRCTIAVSAYTQIRRLAPHVDFSDAELAELQECVRAADYREGFYRGLVGNRVLGLDAINNPDATGLGGIPALQLRVMGRASLPAYLRMMGRDIEASRKPWAEAIATVESIKAEGNPKVLGIAIEKLVRSPVWEIMMQPLAWTHRCAAKATVDARCTDVVLGAIRYYNRHARLPDRLLELVPDYLTAVPVNPFDGEQIRYQLTEDGFRLFSIGADRQDKVGASSQKMRRPDIAFEVVLPKCGGNSPPATRSIRE